MDLDNIVEVELSKEGIDIIESISPVDVDVVQVEQHTAARSFTEQIQEAGLAELVIGHSHVARIVFKQEPLGDLLLHDVCPVGDELEHLLGQWKRQRHADGVFVASRIENEVEPDVIAVPEEVVALIPFGDLVDVFIAQSMGASDRKPNTVRDERHLRGDRVEKTDDLWVVNKDSMIEPVGLPPDIGHDFDVVELPDSADMNSRNSGWKLRPIATNVAATYDRPTASGSCYPRSNLAGLIT